jgi:hypothetical protein
MGSISWYGLVTAMSSEIEVTGIVEVCHNSESEIEAFEGGWVMGDGNVGRRCVIFEDICQNRSRLIGSGGRSLDRNTATSADESSSIMLCGLPLSVDLRMLTDII